MIPIDRNAVKKPARLDKACSPALDELRNFFGQQASIKAQRSVVFEIPHIEHLKRPLHRLFHDKCAYCETKLKADESHIDPFRPKINAISGTGAPSRERYWWLLYEWENNYLSCFTCNRHKGSYFPLKGRRAAKAETKGPDLDDVEKRLLLDPCADDPSESLFFSVDGTVSSLDERGSVTIETIGLNREGLVRARAEALEGATGLLAQLDAIAQTPREARTEEEIEREAAVRSKLLAEIADASEYAAAKRQLIEPALKLGAGERPVVERALENVKRDITGRQTEWEYGSVWITEIEITNFKAISSLSLRFPEPVSDYDSDLATLFRDLGRESDKVSSPTREPWLMLLGENGIGKSSILQALTLAFMSDRDAHQLLGPPSKVVNRRARSGKGSVRIHFNRSDTPLEVTFDKDGDYEWNYSPPPIPVIAYGATRLPALSDEPLRRRSLLEVENLYDPRAGLTDPERTFADASRVESKKFNAFARSLKLLLNLDDDVRISRRSGQILVKLHREQPAIALRDNSDGYRSIAALATDIMENLATDWLNMESAEGTVVLDEIEAHLHPSWKISTLR